MTKGRDGEPDSDPSHQMDEDDKAALDQAMELLRDRFSTVVILAEVRVEDGGHLAQSHYSGSISSAIGLCYRWAAHTTHNTETW